MFWIENVLVWVFDFYSRHVNKWEQTKKQALGKNSKWRASGESVGTAWVSPAPAMAYTINIRRLLHWGPILALTVITVISLSSINCMLQWWPPATFGGIINFSIYMFWNVTTLYNFFHAAFVGPGHVPFGWKPVSFFIIQHSTAWSKFCWINMKPTLQ